MNKLRECPFCGGRWRAMAKKENKYTLIKNDDVDKYLSLEQVNNLIDTLQAILAGREKDKKKIDNSYIICNQDEPYADKVWQVILDGEDEKVAKSNG